MRIFFFVPGPPKRPSLQVCVSLDPPLSQPGVSDDALGVVRISPLALDQRIKDWIRDCGSALHCRQRNYDALARLCVCVYACVCACVCTCVCVCV
jgi:hypothetical protein